MAARTPVTIESSPAYDAYQPPSITPDSLRRSVSTTSITRSSPQLLSPSAFLRPRTQPLKSGSRAQQVPTGAQAGFASAATLLKEQSDAEDARVENGSVTGSPAPPANAQARRGSNVAPKSAGKLTRPKKTPKSGKSSLKTEDGPESPRFDSFLESRNGPSKSHAKDSGTSRVNSVKPPGEAITSRRPSMNIFEYSFSGDIAPAQPSPPTKDVQVIKKVVRKRVSKTTETGGAPVAKKSRKCKAKSEAIILDSDEPEEALAEASPADTTDIPVAKEHMAKKPRPRKTKQSKVNESTEEVVVVTAATTRPAAELTEKPGQISTKKSSYFDQGNHVVQAEGLPSSPPPILHSLVHADAHVEPDRSPTTELLADNSHAPAELAPRRHRSWTPAEDSISENVTNTLPLVNHELDENMDQVPFTEMLGNFSYLQSEPAPIQRTVSGEASTKRRRIELSEKVGVVHPQGLNASEAKATTKAKAAPKATKPAKKPKAVPKKPQTVTALALAAYQPSKEPDPVQSTVSTYFTPHKDVEKAPLEELGANKEDIVAKVKKPRKSRAKVPPADGDAAPEKKSAKTKTKTTKVKVKFDKNDYQAPLYSPKQACKQMRSQDFIFGTSSQLAADESPDFVRDMQLAIQQSELSCALPSSSQNGTQVENSAVNADKSYARVPTAPHGTCLSVEQAGRELWCVSARDSTGSKLAQEPSLPLPMMLPAADDEPIVRVIDIIALSSSGRDGQDHNVVDHQKLEDSHLKSISPSPGKSPQAPGDRHFMAQTSPDKAERALPVAAHPENPPLDEDWKLLRSDDSELIPHPDIPIPQERPRNLATSPARRTALQPLDANIPMIAPDLFKTLDTKLQTRPFSATAASPDRKKVRTQPPTVHLDSSPALILSPKRGRGRPRKDSSLERPAQTSPTRERSRTIMNSSDDKGAKTSPVRGRGRPCKDVSIDEAGSVSPKRTAGHPSHESMTTHLLSLSPKRPVGRPLKEITLARRTSQSPKRPVGRPRKDDAASNGPVTVPPKRPQQPLKDKTIVLSSSVSPTRSTSGLGEVSVADRASSTSPKRPVGRPRQSTTTVALSPRAFCGAKTSLQPAASQPVTGEEWTRIDEISDSDSPPTPSPRRRRASASPEFVRPLDFDMPCSPAAVPVIAVPGNVAIKATDANWPAIQTSIFPQIAETIQAAPIGNDMTTPSWHEKILLYDPIVLEDLTAWLNQQGLRFEIERLKQKPKTKGRKKKDAPPEVDEWEAVKYELKAWMVQKWCEDNSICCLWKEGLRGGVKARY
jgi:hypothetical protein